MRLYIVRHGNAGEHGDARWPDDDLRPLTDKGRKRFARLIKKLSKRGFAPRLVATSPLLRCRQTAEVIVQRLGNATQLVERNELVPGSDLASLVAWTAAQQIDEMAWVGHVPDVERMTAALIGSDSSQLRFDKGAVAALDFDDQIGLGSGELQWLVAPTLLGC